MDLEDVRIAANLATGLGFLPSHALLSPGHPGLGLKYTSNIVSTTEMGSGTSWEVSGTQVALRSAPGLTASVKGYFNNRYGRNNDIVVGTPDQVTYDGDPVNADGWTWGKVTATSGDLAGQSGYMALAYMAPVGWTASHGGTAAAPVAEAPPAVPGGPPAVYAGEIEEKKPDYTTWILVGAGALGVGIIGWALLAKPKRRRAAMAGRRRRLAPRRRRR